MKIIANNNNRNIVKNKMYTLVGLTLLSVATMSTTVITTPANAEIYKWTDANGQVHYSATPPRKKVKTKEIGNEIKMAAGKFDPASVKPESDTEESDTDNTDDASQTDGKNKPTKERLAYCKTQRKNLALLENNKNIRWKSFGKETELNDAQRKSKINQIKSQITSECKGI
jgi:hypothetical protein